MSDDFLRLDQVTKKVCLSKTEIYRRINLGKFPKPIPLGRFRIAFLESEIQEWMATCIANRSRASLGDQRKDRARNAIRAKNNALRGKAQ